MPTGLLLDADTFVAQKLFEHWKIKPFGYDRAIGLVNSAGMLNGVVLFHGHTGCNVEMSYYGKGDMTLGVTKALARFIIHVFDPARLTVVTSKRNRRLIKVLQRIGFKLEGTMRCYYGKHDTNRNTGVRLVAFRADIDRVAKFQTEKVVHAC